MGTESAASVPNPGSDEALAMGCKCPVLDNNHGKFPPREPDGWWKVEGCPVHHYADAPLISHERPSEETFEEFRRLHGID